MKLKNKTAIVTGASSGIGAAIARNLHEAGMKLLITARRADRLEGIAEELPGTVFLAGDIADPAVPQALLEIALEKFGRLDVVCNNAGFVEKGTIEAMDVERMCEMVRVNVEAMFRVTYLALRHFKGQDRGHLVNTSSILGQKVRPTVGAYAGTKHAIEALTDALRIELAGSNVAVSCVQPGLVLTELHDHWDVHPVKSIGVPHPLQPEDVARCVRFILEQPAHVRIPKLLVVPGEQEL